MSYHSSVRPPLPPLIARGIGPCPLQIGGMVILGFPRHTCPYSGVSQKSPHTVGMSHPPPPHPPLLFTSHPHPTTPPHPHYPPPPPPDIPLGASAPVIPSFLRSWSVHPCPPMGFFRWVVVRFVCVCLILVALCDLSSFSVLLFAPPFPQVASMASVDYPRALLGGGGFHYAR